MLLLGKALPTIIFRAARIVPEIGQHLESSIRIDPERPPTVPSAGLGCKETQLHQSRTSRAPLPPESYHFVIALGRSKRAQSPRVKYLETSAEPAEPLSPQLPDFSLILGGPLFQLLRRAHLSGDAADLVWRRMIALALITWLPLLALSIAEGHAWGDSVRVPFLFDVDVHARFLLALPLLIVAELVVHRRMRLVVGTFVKRGLAARRCAREV